MLNFEDTYRIPKESLKACCELNESKSNYKVNTVRIEEPSAQVVGYIITLTDITKYMDMVEELNNLASRDMLTGLFNRRYFVKLSSQELEKSKRFHYPLSLIILDIDFFKQVNDYYGHHTGDAVLQKVAGICVNSIRSTDILGRFGSEEFVIFLPETTLVDGQIIANRILTHIAAAEIYYEGNCIKVTASLGITGVDYVTKESLNYLLKIADMALYQAKSDGRNCVRSIATTA